MIEPILDKIRKLLRLGKSSNPHEAALALSHAFELARKHQIDLDSVSLDDEAIERFLQRIGLRVSFERKLVMSIVQAYFRVEVVVCRPNMAFIGRPTDIVIAHYVHDFLMRAIRAAVRDFQAQVRRKLSPTRRQNFIQGWIYGVGSKLDATAKQLAIEDSRLAIVSVQDDPRISAATKAFYPGVRDMEFKAARKDRSALIHGYAQGRKVDIRQPLSGPAQPTLTR